MQYTHQTFQNKTILITGGAGFIGSSLALYLQHHHPQARIIIFDRFFNESTFSNGNPQSLGHFKNLIGFRGEIITGDINLKQDLARLDDFCFDYIFHQAAISDTTTQNQELIFRTNINAFKDILALAQKNNAILVYASSAGTYGNTKAPNQVGEGEIPENAYGFSKLMMDHLAMQALQTNPSLQIIGLRYFNVYGPNESHKGKSASMIYQLSLQALQNKKVKLFQYGEQKRDFVYIQDVIQANIKALSAKSGVYNVGYGEAWSFNAICEGLREYVGDFEIEYINNPYAFFQNHTHAEISQTKTHLHYSPQFDLKKGLATYLPILIEQHKGLS